MRRGFTLIELLVVIAIIGLLSSIVLASLSTARSKAKIAKARAELNGLVTAITLLTNDTGRMPSTATTKPYESGCLALPDPNQLEIDSPAAGISSTDGNFPGWAGPYMTVPLDPWGNHYVFDDDYDCVTSVPRAVGCEGAPAGWLRVVHSSGPNASAMNIYDSDNIVKVMCAR